MARKRDAPFTSFIVLSCSMIFLTSLFTSNEAFYNLILRYGIVPRLLFIGRTTLTLVTYMFFHAGFQHLITNMFVLLSVGRIIERDLGTGKFGVIYIGSGLLAGLAHAVFDPRSSVPVIGASGAIFGLIAVMLLLMPFEMTTALIIPLPGVVVGILLLIVEVFSLVTNPSSTVAHDIHLFGFFFGGVAAFGVDYNRALRGLIIAIIILVALYVWAVYFNGLSF
jgi:membrane associated rhomboid family serine protease